ncbi:MAG: hypothetical protein ACR2KG_01145 [Nocardioidaceae bacterium]
MDKIFTYTEMGSREPEQPEDTMSTATDVAREIGVSRRAEAKQAALSAAVRLAKRERRLQARIERLNASLSSYGEDI